MKAKTFADKSAKWLLIAGGLNWGTAEVLNFNFVEKLVSAVNLTSFTPWVYGLVGASAVWAAYNAFKK